MKRWKSETMDVWHVIDVSGDISTFSYEFILTRASWRGSILFLYSLNRIQWIIIYGS